MNRKTSLCLGLTIVLNGCSGPTAPVYSGLAKDPIDLYMIDVGQADAMVLTSGESTMIIDGGNVRDGNRIVHVLESLDIDDIDIMIATHPHEDHIGGLQDVLDHYPVDVVYTPTIDDSSMVFEIFMDHVKDNGSEVIIPDHGSTIDFNGATITLYHYPTIDHDDKNNTSIVTYLNSGSTNAYFMADAEVEVERSLLKDGVIHKADLIKIGHHGSYTSTSKSLINAMDPSIALISCGKDNDYGYPHEETMETLNDHDITIYRTDLDGDIHCTLDGSTTVCSPYQDFGISIEKYEQPVILFGPIYIGNTNSYVVHSPLCKNLPKAKNQIIFESLDQAHDYGYTNCNQCLDLN